MEYPFIVTNKQLTIFINGLPRIIHAGSPNFDLVVSNCRTGNFEDAIRNIDKKEQLETFCEGKIILKGHSLYYQDEPLDNSLTKRLLDMRKQGFDVQPMVNFMSKLIENPSRNSIKDLYRFLQHNNMPITNTGDFLGYKWVNNDFTDCHTGKIYNTVGTTLSMPRNQVDKESNHTCSTGFHICSEAYGKFGSKLLLCSISPEYVVAVPPDYDNSKMRVCQYTIIKEIPESEYIEWAGESVYVNTEDDSWDEVDDFNDIDDGWGED